jgi:uncharacterized protein YndB with AHSA1/START domain
MDDIRLTTSVTIDAPVERVWEALTTPEQIKGWFFGVDTESDWKAGGTLTHTGEWQGTPYADKGEILRIQPPTLLVHTHWSDVSGLPDEPTNYQQVTWALAGNGGSTLLTITERNLPSQEAKETSEEGWKVALMALKHMLEA